MYCDPGSVQEFSPEDVNLQQRMLLAQANFGKHQQQEQTQLLQQQAQQHLQVQQQVQQQSQQQQQQGMHTVQLNTSDPLSQVSWGAIQTIQQDRQQ